MRYKATHYAQALVEALTDTTPETAHVRIRAFGELLKKHRMLGKAQSIGRAAERRLAAAAGVRRVLVESVASNSAVQKEITDLLDGKVWIEEKVRPELIAGIRILIDDETLIDASAERRLAVLFKKAS